MYYRSGERAARRNSRYYIQSRCRARMSARGPSILSRFHAPRETDPSSLYSARETH